MLTPIAETHDFIIDRLPKALEKVWDGKFMAEDPENRDHPSLHREYVFDFHSGLRLVISLESHEYDFGGGRPDAEKVPVRKTVLHVSASWDERSKNIPKSVEELQQVVKENLEKIRLYPDLAVNAYLTRSVLHIVYDEIGARTVLARRGMNWPELVESS